MPWKQNFICALKVICVHDSECRVSVSQSQTTLNWRLFYCCYSLTLFELWIVTLCPAGQITLSEFMEGAQKDEWVMNLLKLDINATGWVIQNCEKLPWSLAEWVHHSQVFVWHWHASLSFLWLGGGAQCTFSRLQVLPWFCLLVQRSESVLYACRLFWHQANVSKRARAV